MKTSGRRRSFRDPRMVRLRGNIAERAAHDASRSSAAFVTWRLFGKAGYSEREHRYRGAPVTPRREDAPPGAASVDASP